MTLHTSRLSVCISMRSMTAYIHRLPRCGRVISCDFLIRSCWTDGFKKVLSGVELQPSITKSEQETGHGNQGNLYFASHEVGLFCIGALYNIIPDIRLFLHSRCLIPHRSPIIAPMFLLLSLLLPSLPTSPPQPSSMQLNHLNRCSHHHHITSLHYSFNLQVLTFKPPFQLLSTSAAHH